MTQIKIVKFKEKIFLDNKEYNIARAYKEDVDATNINLFKNSYDSQNGYLTIDSENLVDNKFIIQQTKYNKIIINDLHFDEYHNTKYFTGDNIFFKFIESYYAANSYTAVINKLRTNKKVAIKYNSKALTAGDIIKGRSSNGLEIYLGEYCKLQPKERGKYTSNKKDYKIIKRYLTADYLCHSDKSSYEVTENYFDYMLYDNPESILGAPKEGHVDVNLDFFDKLKTYKLNEMIKEVSESQSLKYIADQMDFLHLFRTKAEVKPFDIDSLKIFI